MAHAYLALVTIEFAGEVLHLVSESLSNVRRHTDSTRAAIRMRGEDEWLCIEVRDEGRSAGTRETRERAPVNSARLASARACTLRRWLRTAQRSAMATRA